ncbi:MAG: sulfatase [Bryobacteraceae bacterium]
MITRRTFIAAAAGIERRPNLVYIFADQLRYSSCGYAGDERARTPNIDRLAAASANFRSAISSTPLCAPYRASLLTGKYQSSTGMVINELRLSPEHDCLGHVLTRGGYQTAYLGKWHLWANELGGHDKTKNAFVPPGPYRLGFDGYWAAYNFNHSYIHSPYFRDAPEREFHQQYEPDSQTGMAIEFMGEASRKTEPFALFLSWGPPHDPWDRKNVQAEDLEPFRNVDFPRPPNFSETQDPYVDNWARLAPEYLNNLTEFERVYYAQTASIDRNVGRIVRALDELGIAGNTILVFTSDHGEMFGAQGRRAKNIFYEEAVRVPMLVRWPHHIRPHVTDACMGTPDIMPTLLGLLKLPIPKAVEGSDLSGVALGRTSKAPGAAYLQGMGTTAAWQDGTEWRAMRDREHTFGVYRRDGRELLFDLRRDPWQRKNLAEERSHRAKAAHYRGQLAKWRKERNDSFESCTWYRDRWTKDRNIVMTASGVKQSTPPA